MIIYGFEEFIRTKFLRYCKWSFKIFYFSWTTNFPQITSNILIFAWFFMIFISIEQKELILSQILKSLSFVRK